MANSVIWRVRTEVVGSLQPFKSEYEMEAFLMNNPALIGCGGSEDESQLPCLDRIRQQLSTTKGSGAHGRIDLIGLVSGEDQKEPTLKIFELKVGEITAESVKQLAEYLEGWHHQESARSQVKLWLIQIGSEMGLAESDVEGLLKSPQGVLVGSSFAPEAIAKATQLKIEGVRLARFRAESDNDYFVIIEDQIGKIVESARKARTVFSWQEIKISPNDQLYIEVKGTKGQKPGQKIFARPNPESMSLKTKKLVFDKESVQLLLECADQIVARSDKYSAWVKDELRELKTSPTHPVGITRATALVFFAFGDRRKSWWIPAYWWVLKRTSQTISDIEAGLKQG